MKSRSAFWTKSNSKVEPYPKFIFTRSSTLDVWLGTKCASENPHKTSKKSTMARPKSKRPIKFSFGSWDVLQNRFSVECLWITTASRDIAGDTRFLASSSFKFHFFCEMFPKQLTWKSDFKPFQVYASLEFHVFWYSAVRHGVKVLKSWRLYNVTLRW